MVLFDPRDYGGRKVARLRCQPYRQLGQIRIFPWEQDGDAVDRLLVDRHPVGGSDTFSIFSGHEFYLRVAPAGERIARIESALVETSPRYCQ